MSSLCLCPNTLRLIITYLDSYQLIPFFHIFLSQIHNFKFTYSLRNVPLSHAIEVAKNLSATPFALTLIPDASMHNTFIQLPFHTIKHCHIIQNGRPSHRQWYINDLLIHFPHLTHLHFHNIWLHNISSLTNHPSIQYIEINSSTIEDISSLASCSKLHTIKSTDCVITTWYTTIQQCSNLKTLYLDQYTSPTTKLVTFNSPNLRKIHLTPYFIRAHATFDLTSCTNLRTITWSGNPILLQSLHSLSKLKRIKIQDDIYPHHLSTIQTIKKLRYLKLYNSNNVIDISALQKCNIQHIEIKSCEISSLNTISPVPHLILQDCFGDEIDALTHK